MIKKKEEERLYHLKESIQMINQRMSLLFHQITSSISFYSLYFLVS